ncbi:hypothetical protein FGG08_006686 [Glutinoglossum americanum]|uniref:Uncharacterized protein n=1 Tax=Glutinoglossum americanum TaxID=1670608 RepID=A0A9P8I108_9PEZI|nr:hypothetical protein FGG08_006686 [Glutinoglossum americanum]
MPAASDQRATKPPQIAYHPIQAGYLQHLTDAYATPRIEYSRALAPRNPYIARADEIGPYHNIPGVGHLGLDLIPPSPWKEGDELVNPEEATYLFEKAREKARAEHERLDIDNMLEGEKLRSQEVWLRNLRKDELIRQHRIDIWNRFTEEKQAYPPHRYRQPQSNFDSASHLEYPKSHQHFHNGPAVGTPQGKSMRSQQSQSTGLTGDLPSPSGLDPYLIRQSVESAIDRFQSQLNEMELKRLMSEKQLGNVLDHFGDHIGKTPSAPLQSRVSVPALDTPMGLEEGAAGRPTFESEDVNAPIASGLCDDPSAMLPGYRASSLTPSRRPYNLPPPQIDHSQSPSTVAPYISTNNQNIPGRLPMRSSFGSNEVHVQNAIHDPLFGDFAQPQSISHPDQLTTIREALGSSLTPARLWVANRWVQNSQQAGKAVETTAVGAPSTGRSSNVELYQGKSPHGGMHRDSNPGTSQSTEVRPMTGIHSGGGRAAAQPKKTTNRVPKKREKKTWYNKYLQGVEHPTNIPTKEYIGATLAEGQPARDAKPRTRGRKAPLKFDEKRGFPLKQSLANEMIMRGIVQASYTNAKSIVSGTSSPGRLGEGSHLIADVLAATGGTIHGLPTNSESAIPVPTATDRKPYETFAGSGSTTRPGGRNQRIPVSMLFSTLQSRKVNTIPSVSTSEIPPI